MKQFVRSFSIGLFVASLIIFIFYNYFAEPEFDANDLSTDELIDLVEDDGYRVITEEEYITYTVNDEENNKKDDKDNKKKKDDKDVEKYTLEIKSDMSSKKIAKLLEKEKIIKDASKFNKFMNKNDYSEDIEPGKFDLTSDMAEKEIAKTITDK